MREIEPIIFILIPIAFVGLILLIVDVVITLIGGYPKVYQDGLKILTSFCIITSHFPLSFVPDYNVHDKFWTCVIAIEILILCIMLNTPRTNSHYLKALSLIIPPLCILSVGITQFYFPSGAYGSGHPLTNIAILSQKQYTIHYILYAVIGVVSAIMFLKNFKSYDINK